METNPNDILQFFRADQGNGGHPDVHRDPTSLLSGELRPAIEKVRKGLGDAPGFIDDNALNSQAGEGEAHSHSVIVVGLDGGRPDPRGRYDPQAIRLFLDRRPHRRQLFRQC